MNNPLDLLILHIRILFFILEKALYELRQCPVQCLSQARIKNCCSASFFILHRMLGYKETSWPEDECSRDAHALLDVC